MWSTSTGESYTLYTISGVPRAEFEKFPLPRNTALFGPTFRGERIIRLDDVTRDPAIRQNAPHYGMPRGHLPVTSYFAVPVVSRTGEVIGGLFFGHEKPGVFPERLEPIMAGVAAQLAIAIDNARLLDQEQRARAAAEAASRAKDEFLAMLSHELRTPLNAVFGWARMLRTGELAGRGGTRALDVIVRNANAQAQLIDDMLDVSRIVTGKMRLDVRAGRPPSRSSRRAIDAVRPAADAKGIRLQPVLDPQALGITGDADRLQQVVWNLLINAVKFTPAGRPHPGPPAARELARRDHRERHRPGHRARRAAPRLRAVPAGRQHLDPPAHAASVSGWRSCATWSSCTAAPSRRASAGEGQGSTFTVKLPIAIARPPKRSRDRRAAACSPPAADAAPTESKALSRAARPGGGRRPRRARAGRDDPDRPAGAEVRTGSSAAEGLETLRAWRPDVLISDIEMPGEDGYTLIRQVRALESGAAARDPGRRAHRLRPGRGPAAHAVGGLQHARAEAGRSGRAGDRRGHPRRPHLDATRPLW